MTSNFIKKKQKQRYKNLTEEYKSSCGGNNDLVLEEYTSYYRSCGGESGCSCGGESGCSCGGESGCSCGGESGCSCGGESGCSCGESGCLVGDSYFGRSGLSLPSAKNIVNNCSRSSETISKPVTTKCGNVTKIVNRNCKNIYPRDCKKVPVVSEGPLDLIDRLSSEIQKNIRNKNWNLAAKNYNKKLKLQKIYSEIYCSGHKNESECSNKNEDNQKNKCYWFKEDKSKCSTNNNCEEGQKCINNQCIWSGDYRQDRCLSNK
jgi:hypothetical protein